MEEDQALTLESFAAELAAADNPPAGSDADTKPDAEAKPDDNAEQQPDAPEDGQPQDAEPTEEGEEAATDDELVEWTTSAGEKYSVTARELRDGYMRQKDYTSKTAAVAEQRNALASERQAAVQALQAERQAARDTLQERVLLGMVQQEMQQIQGANLGAMDPMQQMQLQTRFLTLQQAANQVQARIREKTDAFEAQQAGTRARDVETKTAEALRYAQERIPNFDAKTIPALEDACIKAGYTKAELSEVLNGRLIEDLWKARQYDALKTKAPARKADAPAPALPAPRRQATAPSKAQELSRAINLKRNFSTREFASLLNTAERL